MLYNPYSLVRWVSLATFFVFSCVFPSLGLCLAGCYKEDRHKIHMVLLVAIKQGFLAPSWGKQEPGVCEGPRRAQCGHKKITAVLSTTIVLPWEKQEKAIKGGVRLCLSSYGPDLVSIRWTMAGGPHGLWAMDRGDIYFGTDCKTSPPECLDWWNVERTPLALGNLLLPECY